MKRILIAILGASAMAAGCARGLPKDEPPIRLLQNMYRQEKFKAQSENPFFADGSAMRLPVAGTVARGYLRDDVAFYEGKTKEGDTIRYAPIDITMETMLRGQERYNIYCSPCHSRVGDGKGIVVERGYTPAPTYHDNRLRNVPDGHIFLVITNGWRNMPSYRNQISVEDRWAIVAYIRALQRSQNATLADVPENMRRELQIKQ
ncbi:MAG: cytochrome c [Chloroherpetonaceae bacterium]|nr:cytochrome c [Chloroherpetonaceae bacterium]MDW8437780.1 cytochrome c [Chloroherpetonaceae bacterium]